jgi:lipoprotein-anchoring transpeptidase ErfK/SrfK
MKIQRITKGLGHLAVTLLAAATLGVVPAAAAPAGDPVVEPHDDGPRVDVSISARQVSLYRGAERVATYRIGVGQEDWPTRTGEWHIYQIDFNPDWTPPTDEEWAADREYKEPGHPRNPMGRVRMRYDPPRSIHGTDDEESIGRAESHGSIRISNPDGIELARSLMAAAGDTRSDEWWERTLGNESEMVTVELSTPIPIRVREE